MKIVHILLHTPFLITRISLRFASGRILWGFSNNAFLVNKSTLIYPFSHISEHPSLPILPTNLIKLDNTSENMTEIIPPSSTIFRNQN